MISELDFFENVQLEDNEGKTSKIELLNVFNPGSTYVKVVEYFQDEKESFKGEFNFDDAEKFISRYFDPKVIMRVTFLQDNDESCTISILF